jgi:CRISPR type IV-associated protein Csf2
MIHANLLATLKSPLSHQSGEQHTWYENGNRSEKRVVRLHMRKHIHYPGEQGTIQALVPMYQGNSWRGLLRYHLGLTILDQLSDLGIPITKDLFSIFLSSGGMISAKGEQGNATKDLHTFYEQYPTYWLLGGTFRGKLNRGHSSIGDWIPVCQEGIANHTIPGELADRAISITGMPMSDTYRTPCTNLSMITRRDPKLRQDLLKLLDEKELAEMLDDYQKSKTARGKAKSPQVESESRNEQPEAALEKSAAEQQIIQTETLIEGTPMFGQLSVNDGEGSRSKWDHLEKIGFGCLLIAMERFSRTPFIGGGYRQGFGRIDLSMDVALSPNTVIKKGVTLEHVNGFPLFTISPELQPYRKAGDEALATVVARIKKESR